MLISHSSFHSQSDTRPPPSPKPQPRPSLRRRWPERDEESFERFAHLDVVGWFFGLKRGEG